jgi:hypothetical protein
VAVFLPKLDNDLNSFAGELSISSMTHRYILCVKYNKRLLFYLNLPLANGELIYFIKEVISLKLWMIEFAILLPAFECVVSAVDLLKLVPLY